MPKGNKAQIKPDIGKIPYGNNPKGKKIIGVKVVIPIRKRHK